MEIQSKTVKSVVDTCNLVLNTGGDSLPKEQIEFLAFKCKGVLLTNITLRNDEGSTSIISVPVGQLIRYLQNIENTFKRE